jgi:FADH2 O2-dependent halogenase
VTASFDVAVVGSGFAGSLFALLCRRVGRSVVLIEKGTHPRFAIGESSSPLANLILEELCRRYDLPRVAPLAAWGTWQRRYPEIGVGLKRGFTFYGHRMGQPFPADPERRRQLLVAASPRDEVADTHWYRADFDHFLVREAEREGVEYLDRTGLTRAAPSNGGMRLEGSRLGQPTRIDARVVVDATGPCGFLHRALGLPESPFPGLPPNEGLYAHFEEIRRTDEMDEFAASERPPYPPDDAALHHVFDGGWIWVLRFASGIVSAGVAAEPRLARELRLGEGQAAWDRLLARLPTVREQFARARRRMPFVHAPVLPFRSGGAASDRWALLPSAAAFVDPLLSTGFPLALLGIERLVAAVEMDWGTPAFPVSLARYGRSTLEDAATAGLLVAALYAAFDDFELFAALALLYFASASFTEAARRLGRTWRAGSFLCRDRPAFGPALGEICREAIRRARGGGLGRAGRERLLAKIRAAIAPLDVAGLGDPGRRGWHPVEAAPLLSGAAKLGATRAEVRAMLAESGFFPKPSAAPASRQRPAQIATRALQAAPGSRGIESRAAHHDGGLDFSARPGEQRPGPARGAAGRGRDDSFRAIPELRGSRAKVHHPRSEDLAGGGEGRRRDLVQRQLGRGAGLQPRRSRDDLRADVEND